MSEPEQHADSLRAVTSAAARLNQLEASQKNAAAELARVMYEAHKQGHTWSAIASSAGLASPHTARTRARHAMDPKELSPSARWRQEQGHTPRPKSDPPGVSISHAARELGVTRKTVYAWVEAGKLRSAQDEAGRTRVLLDD